MTTLHISQLALERLAKPAPPSVEASALALETLSRPSQPAFFAGTLTLEILRPNVPEQGRGQQLVLVVVAG